MASIKPGFINVHTVESDIWHVENPDVVRNILVKREASIKLFKGNTGNGNCGQWSNVHF